MSNEDRTRILNMLASGQISAAEAGDLLSALDNPPPAAPVQPVTGTVVSQIRPSTARSLVIRVVDKGDAKVNVRIPLGLARAAGRFLPRQAKATLNEYEIDLDRILDEINGSAGSTALIEVKDEDTHVFVGIE